MTYDLLLLFCLVSNPSECVWAKAGPEIIPHAMSAQMCHVIAQQAAAQMMDERDTLVDGKGPYFTKTLRCVAGKDI